MRRTLPGILALAGLLAASVRHLEGERTRLGLAESREGTSSAWTLLGGFRGLYVDVLWYRSEGLYLESPPPLYRLPLLYSLIGRLQPQYLEMWYYTGMRLAFDAPNSVPGATPEDDWIWARRGIEHMEEGLRRNRGRRGTSELLFKVAETLHRRCTPFTARYGSYCERRYREERGEEPFDRVVEISHRLRDDPDSLPSWLSKAAHARYEQALEADDPEVQDRRLAESILEWEWLCAFYLSPSARNTYVRERPEFYRQVVETLRRNFIVPATRMREAIALERQGRLAEARDLWKRQFLESLVRCPQAERLAQKRLQASGDLADACEETAAFLERNPEALADAARREALIPDLRRFASELRKRKR